MPQSTYTGRITEVNVVPFPRRRRPLVRGRLKPDHQFGTIFFEVYTEPGLMLKKNDRVAYEVDEKKHPISIRRQKFI